MNDVWDGPCDRSFYYDLLCGAARFKAQGKAAIRVEGTIALI